MPDNPQNTSLPQAGDEQTLSLRIIYDEQKRLWNEVDQLRKKQEQQQDKNKSNKSEDKPQGKEKGEDSEKNGEGDEEEESGGGEKQAGEQEDDDQKKKKKPPLKERVRNWTREHPKGTILILIGVVVVLIGGFLVFRYIESYEDTDDAFVDGRTDPISPRISGFVESAYVENTYHVKKGQLLVQLDPRDYEVAKEQALSNLAQAEASVAAQRPTVPITETSQSTAVINAELAVASSQASLASAKEKYESALADLRQAQADEANSAKEAERYRLLVAKEEVSREIYDRYATQDQANLEVVHSREKTANAANKAVDQAEAALKQAQQQEREAKRNRFPQISVQRETLSMREANLKAAQAGVDQAQLNLEYTMIRAPADGIIGDKEVQIGEQVAPGQELLALTQTNDIWVTANFKETQIKEMHPGQSASIHVDALAKTFDGYIEALPGASGAIYSLLPPENATGNYVKVVQRLPVRIRFKPNQQWLERLAPGMSVEPKVWVK